MAQSRAPDQASTSTQGWVPVDTASQWYQLRGQPPGLLLRGKGTCSLNVALCSFVGDLAAKLALSSPTPWGFRIVRDSETLNPVLIPIDRPDPQGAAASWHNAGRRATIHLGKAFMAMGLSLTPAGRGGISIPVDVVSDPATGAPGLMLRVDRNSPHIVKHRGPRKLASAERRLTKAQADLSRLQAAASAAEHR